MAGVQPYLTFPGNCEEAVKFYTETLGGEMLFSSTYKDAPMEVAEEWKNKILHCSFKVKGQELLASDAFPNEKPIVGNNVQLCLNFDKTEKIDDTFKKLATGGKITMGLEKTFWGAYFGMMVDRYGVTWMFNQQLEDWK